MQGEEEGAMPDFDAVLDLDPDNADALSGRGVARSALENYEEAISDLDRSLALQPGNPVAFISRGLAHVTLGVYDKAVDDFGALLEMEPDHTGALTASITTSVFRHGQLILPVSGSGTCGYRTGTRFRQIQLRLKNGRSG